MKVENKEIYQWIRDYRWMSKLVEELESATIEFSSDSFLGALNQENDKDKEMLKQKIEFVDEGLESLTDDKTYWILKLLRDGYTSRLIMQLLVISNKQFYERCDQGIDQMKLNLKTLKGGENKHEVHD